MRGYNQLQYNAHQYNADGNEVAFSDTTTLSDVLITDVYIVLTDLAALDDLANPEISRQLLTDTVRLNDYLSIKERPQSDNWSD